MESAEKYAFFNDFLRLVVSWQEKITNKKKKRVNLNPMVHPSTSKQQKGILFSIPVSLSIYSFLLLIDVKLTSSINIWRK